MISSSAIADHQAEGANRSTTNGPSPGLKQFCLNPFRVLRLPCSATSEDAVWRAEKAQTLCRAGLALPGLDMLPWLPEADELEIQSAAQKMEAPLGRLVEQMMWFNFEEDANAEFFEQALRAGDPSTTRSALELVQPDQPASAAEDPLDEERALTIRIRINLSNLQLCFAFAALHGSLPAIFSSGDEEEAAEPAPLDWKSEQGTAIVLNPHDQIGRGQRTSEHEWSNLLRQGLSGWANLLADPDFEKYLCLAIAELNDELVGAGDSETILQAIRSLLADLLVAEIKACTLGGRLDQTAELARVAAGSGIHADVWKQAFRPLRYLFRSELDDLDALIDESSTPNVEDLKLYLARLRRLGAEWRGLDAEHVLGLRQTIDEGVVRAHERIRALQFSVSGAERFAIHDELKKLYADAAKVASSKSLKERLRAGAEQLDRYRDNACHYCAKREASEFPTVLTGKKETGRHVYGNTTTIHYMVRKAVVARCEPCADLHGLLDGILWGIVGTYLLAMAVAVGVVLSLFQFSSEPPSLGWSALCGAVGVVVAAMAVSGYLQGALTPKGDRNVKDVQGSRGWRDLAEDGYRGGITVNSSKGALNAAMGGRNG
jgi:hypothetical protein